MITERSLITNFLKFKFTFLRENIINKFLYKNAAQKLNKFYL